MSKFNKHTLRPLKYRTIATVLLAATLSSAWVMPTLATDIQQGAHSDEPLKIDREQNWDWTLASWKQDDGSFSSIRKDIDRRFASHSLDARQLATWEADAKKSGYLNSTSVFRWAYASYEAQRASSPVQQQKYVGTGAMEYAKVLNNYEWTRLRFLVSASSGNPHLLPLGQKLLARTPNDRDVLYEIGDCINPSASDQQKALALQYARQYYRLAEDKSEAQTVIAGVFFRTWMRKRDNADADAAVSGYTKYLNMTTPDDPWRPNAERIIRYIEVHPSK